MLGENIQNVSLNATRDLLVAGSTEKGKEIIIAQLKEGLIDRIHYFSHQEIDYTNTQDGGIRTIEFHPDQNILGVNLNGRQVAFFGVEIQGDNISLQKIGQTLEVAKKISVANWHPSGRFFMVANVNWGKGTLGAILNGKGHIINIKFDKAGAHQNCI